MNRFLAILLSCFFITICFAQPFSNHSRVNVSHTNISNISDTTVKDWSQKQIINVYTYYFEDIPIWREKIKPTFTSKGYKEFIDLLNSHNTLDEVIQKKLIVQPTLTGVATVVAKVVSEDMPRHAYSWYVVVPLQITYLGPDSKKSQDFLISLEIVRQNNDNDEIAINSLKVYSNDKTKKSMEKVIKTIKEQVSIE